MQDLWQNEAIRTVLMAALTAIAAALVAGINALAKRAQAGIEAWGNASTAQAALASDEQRRRAADDIVAAVEQTMADKPGRLKLAQAMSLAAARGVELTNGDIEAAVRRLKPDLAGWIGPAIAEGTE